MTPQPFHRILRGPAKFEIDGFVIYDQETGQPIDFIACTKDDSQRERVERGLAMRVDFERFYMGDTRWSA